MAGCILAVGSTYYKEVDLVYPNGNLIGQPVNADSAPTYEIRKDGLIVANPTITVVNDVVGNYSISFVVPAWSDGDAIEVFMLATIGGTAYRHSIGGFTVVVNPSNIIDAPVGTPAVSREYIELIYGANNILRWADADNDADGTKISNRIAWAANRATMFIYSKLSKRFTVPFDPIPVLVAELICERAGVELFISPRGLITGTDEFEAIKLHMDTVNNTIKELLAGTRYLTDYTDTVTQVPKAICNQPIYDYPSLGNPFRQIDGVYIPNGESHWY